MPYGFCNRLHRYKHHNLEISLWCHGQKLIWTSHAWWLVGGISWLMPGLMPGSIPALSNAIILTLKKLFRFLASSGQLAVVTVLMKVLQFYSDLSYVSRYSLNEMCWFLGLYEVGLPKCDFSRTKEARRWNEGVWLMQRMLNFLRCYTSSFLQDII